MLGGLLSGPEDKNSVKNLIKRLCPFSKHIPNISLLVDVFNQARTGKGFRRTAGLGWYNKKTCFEFHKLLVSILIVYANILRLFKLKRNSGSQLAAELAEQLWACGYVVWRISTSRILEHHLRLLDISHWLSDPSKGLSPDRDWQFGYITVDGCVQSEDPKAKATSESKDEISEGDDDQNEEFLRNNHGNHGFKLDEAFLAWIRLQSTYWMAQDIVTAPRNISMGVLQLVEISVVDVKYPSDADREMAPWHQMLMDLQSALGPGIDVRGAITVIEAKIASQMAQTGGPSDPIFRKFFTANYEPEEFSGNLHCEVLLALLAYLKSELEDLEQHIMVRSLHELKVIYRFNGLCRTLIKL